MVRMAQRYFPQSTLNGVNPLSQQFDQNQGWFDGFLEASAAAVLAALP